jgi:NRPS condensation-like uncharacterized protein
MDVYTGKFTDPAKILVSNQSNLLLLTLHHAIFDGKSIEKILNHLQPSFSVNTNHIHNIFSSIENHIPHKKQPLQNHPNNEIEAILKKWQVHHPCKISAQKSKCKIFEINTLNVDSLKSYCRLNNITINQLINALVLKALSLSFKHNDEAVIHTPVDLTEDIDCNIYKEEIGCFITVIQSIIKEFQQKDIVAIAKDYAKVFKENLKNAPSYNQFDYEITKQGLISKFGRETKYFNGGFAVSNIGEIHFSNPKIEKLIKEVYFSTSLAGGLGIFVLSVLTLKKELKLSLSYTSPLLDEKFIDSFIYSFHQVCEHFAKEMT